MTKISNEIRNIPIQVIKVMQEGVLVCREREREREREHNREHSSMCGKIEVNSFMGVHICSGYKYVATKFLLNTYLQTSSFVKWSCTRNVIIGKFTSLISITISVRGGWSVFTMNMWIQLTHEKGKTFGYIISRNWSIFASKWLIRPINTTSVQPCLLTTPVQTHSSWEYY